MSPGRRHFFFHEEVAKSQNLPSFSKIQACNVQHQYFSHVIAYKIPGSHQSIQLP